MSGVASSKPDSEHSGSPVPSSPESMAMVTASESDDDSPVCKKKCISDMSSGRSRTSSRQTERAHRRWVVFDFTGERPDSLMSVPSSWILDEPKSKVDKTSWCYWPKKGSTDEKDVKKLIRNCSDPHPMSWSTLPGRIKGSNFKSWNEAESYVTEKTGIINSTCSTDSEIQRRNLLQLEHQAALKVKENSVLKELVSNNENIMLTSKTLKTPPRGINFKSKTANTTPSTSKTRSNSNNLVNTIPVSRNVDSNSGKRLNTTPSTSRTSVSQALTNSSSTGDATRSHIAESLPSSFETQHWMEDVNVINLLKGLVLEVRDLKQDLKQEVQDLKQDLKQEVQDLKQEVQVLKQEVQELKSKIENSSESTESIVENPFDELRSFGFKAASLEELLEREKQFSEGCENSKKNRNVLLKILIELAPKPKSNSKVVALDIVRSIMQRLADDSVWQYISAFGKSGTKKLSMSKMMPSIMNTVLLTTIKVLSVDTKEASTALSTYLKSTATRAAAKKHKLEHGRAIQLQIDNSVHKETESVNSVRNSSQHAADEVDSDVAHGSESD